MVSRNEYFAYAVFVTALMLFAGCRSAVPVEQAASHIAQEQSGAYLSGTHYWMNWFYFFGGGPTFELKGDQGQYVRRELEWRELEFIKLDAGRYEVYAYAAYLGRSGELRKCFDVGKAQILDIEFGMPFWATASGNLDIEDALSGEEVPVLDNCSS